jgi:hypothetical protein
MVSTELPGALGMMNFTGLCGQLPAARNGKVAACAMPTSINASPAAISVRRDKDIMNLLWMNSK